MTETQLLLFDGNTFDAELDAERLTGQLGKVFSLMCDGRYRTLGEIVNAIGGGSEAGVSARLRDLRKPKFGSHVVNRRRRGEGANGCFEYQLELSK